MFNRKILVAKRDKGTFLFLLVNFKTQECYERYFQFSLKATWWIPKYDPHYLTNKNRLPIVVDVCRVQIPAYATKISGDTDLRDKK